VARYSTFLGQRVEVHYRAGELILPATGTLVADSGKSIFLEEKALQHGTVKTFRWEIPYQCIGSLERNPASCDSPIASSPVANTGGHHPLIDPLCKYPKEI
jgi:hypothetical protein